MKKNEFIKNDFIELLESVHSFDGMVLYHGIESFINTYVPYDIRESLLEALDRDFDYFDNLPDLHPEDSSDGEAL